MSTFRPFVSQATWNGVALLRVTGEMDAARAEQIQQVGEQLLTGSVHTLRVDLSNVVFIDAAGLGCLVALRNKALASGCALIIKSDNPRFTRLFNLCAMEWASQ